MSDLFDALLSRRAKLRGVEGVIGGLRRQKRDAVPLHYGYPYPDSYPLQDLSEAAAASLLRDGAECVNYGGGDLADQFSGMVRDRLRTRGIACGEDEIIITAGSSQAINLACAVFVDVGDRVLVEAPSYMGGLNSFRNFGADMVAVEVDEDGVLTDRLSDMLSKWRDGGEKMPKLLYLIANFNNPSGCTTSLSRRRELLQLSREYGFLILEDDAYGELRFYGEDISPLGALDTEGRVIHVGSMSKILAPGVRLGWAVADPHIIRMFNVHKADGGTSPLARTIVAGYLENADLESRLAQLRAGYRARRDAAVEALEEFMPSGCSWTYPEGGYFIWLTVPEGLDSEDLLPEMAEEGVKPLGGRQFYCDGRGARNFRISYSYPEPEEIRRGIELMARVIRRHLEA
ncbi:MAG: PLP-dependent aminotransferase family protein [Bacillota bacterium]